MLDHRCRASANFVEEGETEAHLFVLEVLNGVVEFALGQLIEGDAHA